MATHSSTNLITSIVVSVQVLLACGSKEEERKAVHDACNQLQAAPSLWSGLTDQEPPTIFDKVLLYALVRAFGSQHPLGTIFKGRAQLVAETMPALQRPRHAPELGEQMLATITHLPWSVQGLQSMSNLIRHIDDPRVRQQAIQFAYSVVRFWIQQSSVEWKQAAFDVLLLGITDVWSVVRKESAHAVSKIVLQFVTLELVDAFVDSLLKLTGDDNWKRQEGALLALNAIMATIQVEKAPTVLQAGQRTVDLIKGGAGKATTVSTVFHIGARHRGIAQLPRSLALRLKPALYTALKHAQTSVRDAAARCFVLNLEICDESTRVVTFQEVMSKLNRLTTSNGFIDGSSTVAGHTTSHQSAELLDAAEAEGLLDVLARLVPYLPAQFLVKHWRFVFPTLERYVVHIASTVRLCSSGVVLALAELSLSDSSSLSIELLLQMLIALAENRDDFGVCWQRLEGRLLSVDVLLGLLGKNHLWCQGVDQNLLHFQSQEAKNTRRPPYLESIVTQATWTINEDDKPRFRQVTQQLALSSIVDRLNAQVVAHQQHTSPAAVWALVLRSWLHQTHAAFASTQFELRRIARQVLPGLVRLLMWCDQLPLLRTADTNFQADSSVVDDGWTWVCIRHLLLHTLHVQQSPGIDDTIRTRLSTARTLVLGVLRPIHLQPPAVDCGAEAEAVVARVESILIANLNLAEASHADQSILTTAWRCAVRDVYANLLPAFRHPLVLMDGASYHDGSLDRQLSIALVHLLPETVQTVALASVDVLTLWRQLERVVLGWLATDDMFRWITIDKASAHESLLLALSDLLVQPIAATALTHDEITFILRTLEAAVPIASGSSASGRLKVAVSYSLVRIYTLLWKHANIQAVATVRNTIVVTLALLASQRSDLDPAKSMASPASMSDWDDWDGDEPDAKNDELRGSSTPVEELTKPPISPVVLNIRNVLTAAELATLRADGRGLLTSGTACHHEDALQELVRALEAVG